MRDAGLQAVSRGGAVHHGGYKALPCREAVLVLVRSRRVTTGLCAVLLVRQRVSVRSSPHARRLDCNVSLNRVQARIQRVLE